MSDGGHAPRLLILDDNLDLHHMLHLQLSPHGFSVLSAYTAADAKALLRTEGQIDLILMDLNDVSGLDLVRELPVPVIVLSDQGSAQIASQALLAGAKHFVLKPIKMDYLIGVIQKTLGLKQSTSLLPDQVYLVGESPCMQGMFQIMAKVAPTPANVLIVGESGSGKELVARAIHQLSPRASQSFIPVNCAASPVDLLESELFGKGLSDGFFADADGGTLFLDEVGDLPTSLQAKILRLLQSCDRDVRVLATTHSNLTESVREGKFREDLYFRLNVVQIAVPPLRERPGDIPLLAQHFLAQFNSRFQTRKHLSKNALATLIKMRWSGNVRELENTIQRAVVLSEADLIGESDLTLPFEESSAFPIHSKEMTLEEVERQYIAHVLHITGGVKEKATKILGIDRKTLYRKERKYGLQQLSNLR